MNQARDEPVNEWVKIALKSADFREKSVTKKGSFFCDNFLAHLPHRVKHNFYDELSIG